MPKRNPIIILNGAKYKVCSKCEKLLPIEQFYARPDSITGYMSQCKACYKSKRKEQRDNATTEWREKRNYDSRKYTERHKDEEEFKARKCAYSHKRRSLLKGSFTTEDWLEAVAYFGNACAYCGAIVPLTMDHIIPISKFGMNYKYNIVPACPHCNSSKSDRDIVAWFKAQPFYTEEKLLKIHAWHEKCKAEFEREVNKSYE